MTKRKDLAGKEVSVGDIIAYNPPYYKGLVFGVITGFAKSGLPQIHHCRVEGCKVQNIDSGMHPSTPKTGFIKVEGIE